MYQIWRGITMVTREYLQTELRDDVLEAAKRERQQQCRDDVRPGKRTPESLLMFPKDMGHRSVVKY